MNKVLKVLSLSFLLCLSLVVAPFHISALSDDLPAPFIGVNIYQDDVEYTGPYGTYWVYKSGDNYRVELQGVRFNTAIPLWHYDFVLDSNYVGDVTVSYTNGSNTVSSIYYVNGNHLEINIVGQVTEFTISDVHLNNVGTGSWYFPIESYSFIKSCFDHNLEQVGLNQYGNYLFPNFKLYQNDVIANLTTYGGNNIFELIFYCNGNINSLSVYNQNFSVTSINAGQTWTVSNFEVYSPGTYTAGQARFLLVHVTYEVSGTDNAELKFIGNRASGFFFMPVYSGSGKYISTDFALNFGLSNDLLDALVYGTDSSNQSASNLNDTTSDLNTSSNQLVTQEDAFNDDMNSALQNIDTNFNVGSNFGSKFIASANWVKTQYDRLTGNTPFGSVISFSLLIGLALLLVGKVFK